MPFIHLVKTIFHHEQEPAVMQIFVAAKEKTALSTSLFQPIMKKWGGESHLSTRGKSSEFGKRMILIQSLCKTLIGFNGL